MNTGRKLPGLDLGLVGVLISLLVLGIGFSLEEDHLSAVDPSTFSWSPRSRVEVRFSKEDLYSITT